MPGLYAAARTYLSPLQELPSPNTALVTLLVRD